MQAKQQDNGGKPQNDVIEIEKYHRKLANSTTCIKLNEYNYTETQNNMSSSND